jgi:hypothetical protein
MFKLTNDNDDYIDYDYCDFRFVILIVIIDY